MIETPLKTTEIIEENLLSAYQNIVHNPALQLDYQDNFVDNYFAWNQQIVSFGSNHDFKSNLPLSIKTINIHSHDNDSPNKNFQLILKARPSIDLGCCYILFHQPSLHQELRNSINYPPNPQFDYYQIFDNFEKARVIAVANHSFLGIVKNILQQIDRNILSADPSSLELIMLNKIFENKILPATKISIQNIRALINHNILQQIDLLITLINDQKKFALQVLEIIAQLNIANNEIVQESDILNPPPSSEGSKMPDDTAFGAESIAENLPISKPESSIQGDILQTATLSVDSDYSMVQENPEDEVPNSLINDQTPHFPEIEFKNLYKIYSNKFDEIIYPKKFINKNDLELLRDQLDLKIAKLANISQKITLKLKRKLLSKKNNFSEFDVPFGVLNRKKLVNLILSPFAENIWVNHKAHEYHDTILTILIDNSGSMRGNPIVMSAMACEIIANILEKFSIKTEIIGFTTADWKGGRVRKLWEINGRPQNPGRLNELRHIIYKSFNQSYKKSKNNLGLMLKEGVLKENIDGEALLFARSRLMQQNARRKILMVISDGTPVDDSTTTNNEGDILSDHLRHVINVIEKQGKIEIIGIGIGHATDDFYKNSIAIKTIDELGDAMIDKIINLL